MSTTMAIASGPRIAFEERGLGAPVLFSHGLFMNRHMFDPQIADLEQDFRCVSWDERSHGETEWEGEYTLWDSARDQLALMDHLDIGKAVLVGMSQGGLLSQRTALLAPDRVAGLVLLSSQAGMINPESRETFTAMARNWPASGGPARDVLDAIAAKILGPGVDEQYWLDAWRNMPPVHVRESVQALTTRDDLTDRLADVTCPVLVIHGTSDASTTVERSTAVAEGVKDCRGLLLIDGAPHAANLTHPTQVTRAIRSFLESLPVEANEWSQP